MTPIETDPAWLLLLVTLCTLRAGVAFAMVPMLSGSSIPRMVLAGHSLAIAVPVVMSRLAAPPPSDMSAVTVSLLLIREGAIGVVVGLGFGAFCAALQSVGEIIDHQTGLTFTQNLDPVHGNNVAVTARSLEQILFALLLGAGLLLSITDALYLSYTAWPPGAPVPALASTVPLMMIDSSAKVFSLALLLAGPVLLALFIIDAGMGLLNRAAPALGVFGITLSLKSVVGLVVLATAMPMVIERSLLAAREAGRAVRVLLAAGS